MHPRTAGPLATSRSSTYWRVGVYTIVDWSYSSVVLGLNASEMAMVLFVLALVVLAGKLPAIGESVGSYLHRRRAQRSGG
jgi:multisubunit Na+/H+ antiporter MnhC subunit